MSNQSDQLDHQKENSRKYQQLQEADDSDNNQQQDNWENLQQNQDTRNKSKENSKREYGCPCGKQYLSYPALFTHIKQKHGGKAPPGQLKKPKTQKARGRPRLPTVNMQQDNSIEQYSPHDQLKRILDGKRIDYNEKYEQSKGNKTCQDVGTLFLNQHTPQQGQERKILACFINYLKYFIDQKYDNKYWVQNSPSQIIDISNYMVRQLDQHREKYPLTKQLLIELIFVLFRWMYKNKFTDHKLVKRSNDSNN